MDQERMESLTGGLKTKADKMRVLERVGVSRADIARFLSVRYQQVRNTLEGDKRTGYQPLAPSNEPIATEYEMDAQSNAFPMIEVDANGVASLPPELINSIPGLPNGDRLFAIPGTNGLFLTSVRGALQEVQRSLS